MNASPALQLTIAVACALVVAQAVDAVTAAHVHGGADSVHEFQSGGPAAGAPVVCALRATSVSSSP